MTAALTIRPAKAEVRTHRPAVRVRPVPPLEPPFDDEWGPNDGKRPSTPLSVRAPELPLDLPARARGRAPRPSSGAVLAGTAPTGTAATDTGRTGTGPSGQSAVAVASGAPGRVDTDRANAAPTAATPAPAMITSSSAAHARLGLTAPASFARDADGPAPSTLDARRATRRFLAACLEVIGGYRPVSHLRPLCQPDRYPLVAERLGGRRGNGQRNLGGARPQAIGGRTPSGSPPRAARGNSAAPGDRVGVLRVQVGEPRAGVAEVAVVLTRRERVWAMAFRLEERDGRWLCTHLEVL